MRIAAPRLWILGAGSGLTPCSAGGCAYLPSRWMVRGWRMGSNVSELRPKPSDSEKITINLGYVDLGHIDLLVQEGFYSNRTDFIRTAIRNQIERHADYSP